MSTIDFSPAPGAAPASTRITRHAITEATLLVRNGEQLLLALVIPLGILLGGRYFGGRFGDLDSLAPSVLGLAVWSSAFTSVAITTGFERRYGVLKRLGATPLTRGGLIAAKTLSVIAIELMQMVIIAGVGLALGWHPHGGPAGAVWVVALVLAGTAAFSGLGLLLAGTLRAEATLAVANLIYLILLGVGGIIFPLTKFPAGARPVLTLLPSGALSDGLRSVLQHGAGAPVRDLAVLVVWAAAAIALAARTFRWE